MFNSGTRCHIGRVDVYTVVLELFLRFGSELVKENASVLSV